MSLLALSPEASALKERLEKFVDERCIPAEDEYDRHVARFSGSDRWTHAAVPPVIERLKSEARSLGLWNLFLPRPVPGHLMASSGDGEGGDGDGDDSLPMAPSMYLSNREYGILCEAMGRSALAPEACNCSAPDTGNMEVLLEHGTERQQSEYLKPLLRGEMRSAFLMTEPDVASSDARNLRTRLARVAGSGEGDSGRGGARYVLSGRKWWSTGAMDPRCGFCLVVAEMDRGRPAEGGGGRSGRRRGDQTVVIVPMSHPGVRCVRPLTVFGYDDAPHGHAEVALETVELDESAVILGEGRGFEISQSRLGPGRIHHCELDWTGGGRPAALFIPVFASAHSMSPIFYLPFSFLFVHVGMRAVGLGENRLQFILRALLFHSWTVCLNQHYFLPKFLGFTSTAARCYELMLERTFQRQTFGKYLHEHGSCREMIADSASDLEAARLLTLACAEDIDRLGARGARDKIALIKVTVPELTSRVVDRAVQVGMFMRCWSYVDGSTVFSSMAALNLCILCVVKLDLWGCRRLRGFPPGESSGGAAYAPHSRWTRRGSQAIVGTDGAEEGEEADAISYVMCGWGDLPISCLTIMLPSTKNPCLNQDTASFCVQSESGKNS
jgi:alkylation response protein AidB-like acyl-CoA dehydrogenase